MEEMEVEMKSADDSNGNFSTQLEESMSKLSNPDEGQIVEGTVVQVSGEFVFVDIGCKSEGRLPVSEFTDGLPNVGDKIQVFLVKTFGANGPEISKSKADTKRIWKDVAQAFKEKKPVTGTILKIVKGGYDVGIGGDIHAFLPISQADNQKVEKPESLLGLKSQFYVERLYSDNKQNIVVNRRKLIDDEVDVNREKFFATAKIGDTVKGVVKSFTSFGAFIDLGGFDGLLHINDMSWGHVARPRDFVQKGQEIEVKVIRLEPDEKRINLSLKHFTEDPWMHFEDKFHVNDIVKGKVTKLTDFGAFVELEEGIEGLVHISEFSWTKKVNKPSDMVKIGDEVECMILGYDIQAGRVSLGIKQVTPNPWDTIQDKYPVGTKVTGKVVKITNAGAFVALEDGIDAFLHADDISWTKKIKHIGSELAVKQEVSGMIIECDPEQHHLKIGLKQVLDNPWKAFAKAHEIGSTLEGEITSITDFGVFVRTDEGLEGLINKANLSENRETPYEDAVKNYKVGDKINVYIVDISPEKEKVAFSVREFKKKQQRSEMSQYMSNSAKEDDGAYTLGDFLKNQKNG